MRFSASFSDQGSIETFTRCLHAMARMSKKSCAMKITPQGICFICCPATGVMSKDGGEYWCAVLVPFRPIFQAHSFSGLDDSCEEKNAIVLELNIENLANCLTGNHANTKIKLTNKDNTPHLRVELRSLAVVHDVPVTVVQSKKWSIYDQPSLNDRRCALFLPSGRTILRVLKSLKNMSSKFLTLKASNTGELELQSTMRNGDVSVFFTDLANETLDEDNPEQEVTSTKLQVKPLHEFFNSFCFAHSRFKFTVLAQNTAEFSLAQDDFEISFIIGESKE